MTEPSGLLALAATPLGNPADASARLRHWLHRADVVAAEDTRRLRRLAADLEVEVRGRVVSNFDANEAVRAVELAEQVAQGKRVLVLTDAGMPSISDPGLAVVRECLARELPITCLPGPSAVTTALALSGMAVDRFCFEGFLPRKQGARRTRLTALAAEPRTMVFFESPRRTRATLADMAEVLGADRPAALCRELTKTYEQVVRAPLGDLAGLEVLGEVTLVVQGRTVNLSSMDDLVDEVAELMREGLKRSQAVAQVAASAGVSRRELYQRSLGAGD